MKLFVNQLGYLPKSKKVATCYQGSHFEVINEKKEVVFRGNIEAYGWDDASKEHVSFADFSSVTEPGIYQIRNDLGDISYHFQIQENLYDQLHTDLIRALYFQRCGCELLPVHAGIYQHKACHVDWSNELWSKDEKRDCTGGWHDAGDYGRYITPGAATVGHILYAYSLYPKSFQKTWNLPESGNGIPDVLNECRYELSWMLKLQKEDGSVHHKLSAIHHAPFVMPEEDHDPFYLYDVSTVATGAFAAVMAFACRVYQIYDAKFAESMLQASQKAYAWLQTQKEFSGFHNPEGTSTGEYGDWCDLDERLWAAAELYRTTREKAYEEDIVRILAMNQLSMIHFGWAEVSGFAALSIVTDPLRKPEDSIYQQVKECIVRGADQLVEIGNRSGWEICMEPRDFGWGSNGAIGNKGILLLLADYLCPNQTMYRQCAENQIHYILGRNAADYSYVTGYGEHAFSHPHNRPTESAPVEKPMSGWVSGGANGRPCDEIAIQRIEKGSAPMKCYVDDYRSYSTNEIAIYWNSSILFLVSAFL